MRLVLRYALIESRWRDRPLEAQQPSPAGKGANLAKRSLLCKIRGEKGDETKTPFPSGKKGFFYSQSA